MNLIDFEKVANKKLKKTFFTSPSKCITFKNIRFINNVSINKYIIGNTQK